MNFEKDYKHISILMSLLLLLSMALLSKEAAFYVSGTATQKPQYTVVIDSGHGGKDPGKIASDGTLEKDINLAIALKLQNYLTAADVNVIMTRSEDKGLYDEQSTNKKSQDMKNRIALMESSNADMVISIHQNSYSDSAVHGAQVFYHTSNPHGKTLAEALQNKLISDLDPDNHRKAKANSDYYLLRKTTLPVVIVECGFLSNPSETTLLKSESYQDKIAWILHLGILQNLNQKS